MESNESVNICCGSRPAIGTYSQNPKAIAPSLLQPQAVRNQNPHPMLSPLQNRGQ